MSSIELTSGDSEQSAVDKEKESNHFNFKLDSRRADITKFQGKLWEQFRAAYGEQITPGEILPGIEQCLEITRKEGTYYSRKLVEKFCCRTWGCFALIHPTAGYLTQEINVSFCDVFSAFDISYYSLQDQGFRVLKDHTLKSMYRNLKDGFQISPLSPEWHVRTHVLRSHITRTVDIWMLLEPELLSSPPLLATIAEEIYEVVESLINLLYKVVVELELREEVLRQHLDTDGATAELVTTFPDGLDTTPLPDYPRSSSGDDPEESEASWAETDWNKAPPWYLRIQQFLGSPVDVFRPPHFWKQVTLLAGAQCILIITIVLFCVGGAATVAVAAAWDPEISRIPNVDGNFYSALSGCSMSLGGTYCIVIPLLQGSQNPIRDRKWNRVFHTVIWLACAAAVTSAVAYLYTEAASLLLAYVSALCQLVATIMWVTFSSRRIKNLEFALSARPTRARRQA